MVRNCTISELSRTYEVGGANPVDATQTKGAKFQINNAKLYATVVILSINDNVRVLEKDLKEARF